MSCPSITPLWNDLVSAVLLAFTPQDLLGSSFKQRMMMDGHMDAITFVCTKTDNLHVSTRSSTDAVFRKGCRQNTLVFRVLARYA